MTCGQRGVRESKTPEEDCARCNFSVCSAGDGVMQVTSTGWLFPAPLGTGLHLYPMDREINLPITGVMQDIAHHITGEHGRKRRSSGDVMIKRRVDMSRPRLDAEQRVGIRLPGYFWIQQPLRLVNHV